MSTIAGPNFTSRYRRLRKFRDSVLQVHQLLFCRQGDVSAAEMAEIIGRSERQARQIFHDITGECFRVAQLRARLLPVRAAVRHTPDPISEIAERYGYGARAKLHQSYVSLFGITPAADRLASQGERNSKIAGQGIDSDVDQE